MPDDPDWLATAADMAGVLVGIGSMIVAWLAFKVAARSHRESARSIEEAPAQAAIEHLFTKELAAARYELYDRINEVAGAATGIYSPARNAELRREFNVGPDSPCLPTRYQLARRWAALPARTEAERAQREEFLRLASVLCAAFDALFRAAERGPASAELIRGRVGRLIVWWMLVWPGLFDHTGSFLGRKFVASSDIRNHPPLGPRPAGYTELWQSQPLWSLEDWEGAMENFRTLQATMMPGDPFKGGQIELDTKESIFGQAGDPLDYPGTRPQEPYFLHGSTARRLTWDWDLGRIRLDDGRLLTDVLAGAGATPLEDRVVQVAFGANRDLANLAWKFGNYRTEDGAPVSTDLITLPAHVEDADVVACNIGYWSYVYGGLLLHRPPLLDRPYLEGSRAPVTLLLLDPAQMQALHASEGVARTAEDDRPLVSCDVGVVSVTALGRTLRAQVYGLPLPFLSLDGGQLPVAFRTVATGGAAHHVRRLGQREMWAEIVERLRPRLRPLVGDADPEEVTDLIRAGAASRMNGAQGSGDRGQRLYEAVRTGIIDELALTDPDGSPASGSKHLPGHRHGPDAWQPYPRLGPQLALPEGGDVSAEPVATSLRPTVTGQSTARRGRR